MKPTKITIQLSIAEKENILDIIKNPTKYAVIINEP